MPRLEAFHARRHVAVVHGAYARRGVQVARNRQAAAQGRHGRALGPDVQADAGGHGAPPAFADEGLVGLDGLLGRGHGLLRQDRDGGPLHLQLRVGVVGLGPFGLSPTPGLLREGRRRCEQQRRRDPQGEAAADGEI